MPTSLPKRLLEILGIYNEWVSNPTSNATGTPGKDNMIFDGLLSPIVINGNGGDDRIQINGTLGVITTANGGEGRDQIYGGNAGVAENLNGGNGDDLIEGRGGAIDNLNGGAGTDTLSYEHSTAGVTIDMRKSTNILTPNQIAVAQGGDANGDVVAFGTFENVVGSDYADTINGSDGDNILVGLGGNDTLNGGDGNDTLIGGADADTLVGGNGVDTADYSTSLAGVTVDLNRTTAQSSAGEASGDILTGIENLNGSHENDTLTGNGGDNGLNGGDGIDTLYGGNGNDTLEGGAGGDWLDGGAGSDAASYASSAEAVTINLSTGVISGGDANGDRYPPTLSGMCAGANTLIRSLVVSFKTPFMAWEAMIRLTAAAALVTNSSAAMATIHSIAVMAMIHSMEVRALIS